MLNKGDKIGIVAPSNFIDVEEFTKGIKFLEEYGFNICLGRNIFQKDRYMAGSAKDRAEDINLFFSDSEIKAIFCAKGGSGSIKVLEYLDYDVIKVNPKPVFGFSDSTALQNALISKANNLCYTGLTLTYEFRNGKDIEPITRECFENIINEKSFSKKSGNVLNAGFAEGILVGGCLSVLRQLIGTEFMPEYDDMILLIEDIGEQPYKIEAWLYQLKYCGFFKNVRGIVFGKFEDCISEDQVDGTIDDIIAEFAKDLNIPIIKNYNYGHFDNKYILPIGVEYSLDADECHLEEKRK